MSINMFKHYNANKNSLKVDTLNYSSLNNEELKLLQSIEYIEGELIIENTDIEELSFFNNLKEVTKLKIVSNPKLTNIDGFKSLITLKSLVIEKNNNLTNITGINSLFSLNKKIDGYLKIIGNKNLTEVDFLLGLKEVNKYIYLHNNNLNSLSGLRDLEKVGASLSLSFNSLSSLEALSKLKVINGTLNLKGNNLESLSGLENLSYIKNTKWNSENRSLIIDGNKKINDISSLKNLKDKNHILIISTDFDLKNVKMPEENSIFYENKIEVLDTRYYKMIDNKKTKKKIIGIVSTKAVKRFITESKKVFDSVILIEPSQITYKFIRNSKTPIVEYNGFLLNELSLFFIYSRNKKDEKSILVLLDALESINCPICACRQKPTGKFDRLVKESDISYETTSYVVSSYEKAVEFFHDFKKEDFPLISKPINGSGGYGIEKIQDKKELLTYLKSSFINRNEPIIFEPFINIVKEWRVYLIDGEILTSYEKTKPLNGYKYNLSQGGTMKKTDPNDSSLIEKYIKERLPKAYKSGFIGVDITLKDNNEFYVIEYNMQSGWSNVISLTGVNLIHEMFKVLLKRTNENIR